MNCKVGILTENELVGGWWWRRLVYADFDPVTFTTTRTKDRAKLSDPLLAQAIFHKFQQWEQTMEIAAQRYELVRRLHPERQLPAWTALPICAHSVLIPAIGKNLRKDLCVVSSPPRSEQGWSKPWLPWQWNLMAEDNELVRRFLTMINDERRRQGLPDSLFPMKGKSGKRSSHNKGNRHRKISWRWPELMDIHRWSGRPLKPNERSAKSDAVQEAEDCEPAFLRAWDMIKLSMFGHPDSWKPADHFTRFLSENFVKWYPPKAKESLPK
ncbi:MAG: hypothetical protein EXS31_04055 [Pedosphaera sp.]|nr:hypothetical protein [Pedosphaera sp.]